MGNLLCWSSEFRGACGFRLYLWGLRGFGVWGLRGFGACVWGSRGFGIWVWGLPTECKDYGRLMATRPLVVLTSWGA